MKDFLGRWIGLPFRAIPLLFLTPVLVVVMFTMFITCDWDEMDTAKKGLKDFSLWVWDPTR